LKREVQTVKTAQTLSLRDSGKLTDGKRRGIGEEGDGGLVQIVNQVSPLRLIRGSGVEVHIHCSVRKIANEVLLRIRIMVRVRVSLRLTLS